MKPRTLSLLFAPLLPLACASSEGSPPPAPVALPRVARGEITALAHDGDHLVPTLQDKRLSSLARHAEVRLPVSADGEARIVDVSSGLAVRVAPVGASSVAGRLEEGRVVYRDALGEGAHLVHRVHAEGTEDYAVLPSPRDEVRWTIALEGVAGLRSVAGVLELLDASGTPRLRMERPYVIDASGKRTAAVASLHGCAADTSPIAPWGRPVTRPGATACEVSVALPLGLRYPVVLDPSWVTAGKMTVERSRFGAVLLKDGRVFLMGGFDLDQLATETAELFDPATKTFAATASGKEKRAAHATVLLEDGRVLVAGGNKIMGSTATAELYDPTTGTYADAAPLPSDRGDSTATKLADGRVLLIGGCTYDDATLYCVNLLADAQVYDPAANSWTSGGASKMSRILHSAVLLPDGGVLVVGGLAGAYDLAEIWKNGAFTPAPKPPSDVIDATATLSPGGQVIIAGGIDGFAVMNKATVLYDPSTGAFSKGASLPNTRRGHGAFNLTAGVTLVGGYTENTAAMTTPSVLVTDSLPAGGGGWMTGQPSADPHSHFGGVVLQSGFLLAAGGEDDFGTSTSAAELFGDTCADDSMCGAGYCSPAHVCAPKKDGAAACGGKTECASGNCVDGVCCDTPCLGQCQACDGAVKGTCSAVKGMPHGARPACKAGGSACDGACDGVAAECAFPGATTACGTCSGGSAHQCDGKGTCLEQASKPCAPYVCGAADCTSSCTDDTGCSTGYACAMGKCAPKGSAVCKDDHLLLADGSMKSCLPFKCSTEGVCLQTCDSSLNCATGNTCNSSRVCAPAAAAPGPDSGGGGCGCAVPGNAPASGLFGALVVALVSLVARRRRGLAGSRRA